MAYSIGTISIKKHSNTITGNGTYFVQVAKAQKADLLFVCFEGKDRILQIVNVLDDSTLQVKQLDGSAFKPNSSVSTLKYGLVQNFKDTVTAKLAQRVADLQTQWFTREQQITGWFESRDDTYPATSFLGEQIDIPTPAKIAALAQVAMEASDQLSQMASVIEQNQSSLSTIDSRLTTFESQYLFVVSANDNISHKYNQVIETKNSLESLSATVALQSSAVIDVGEQVTSDKDQVILSTKHAAAHSALCALSTQLMMSSTSRIRAAFEAVLDGTLTIEQINNLF